tara:strand:+ start:533 stop:775 length:243 start_codon:yes stop_codon:yes gene_type:complete
LINRLEESVENYEFCEEHKASIEEFFDIIDSACYSLQEETSCPDEAIDHLLSEAIGTWQLPEIAQLDEALLKQQKNKNEV